jgi:formiminotetrahydrofolate cyclodeaminase
VLERPLADVLEAWASGPDPVPGGGSAAALAAAMAAALAANMARLSSASWPDAEGVAAQAQTLRARVEPLAQADADAYAKVLRRFDQRTDTDLGEALYLAAELPLEIAELASDTATLCALVADRCEPQMRPDAVAATFLAEAAARAAAHLVEVNLSAVTNDERVELARELAESAVRAGRRALSPGA